MTITLSEVFSRFNIKRYILEDPSALFLIFSNLITIFFAVIEDWSLLTLMWIYWFQSVTIGLFNFIRILSLKDFSTRGFYIYNKPVKPTEGTKIRTALFFAFHYGFFHLLYAIFLFVFSIEPIFVSLFSRADLNDIFPDIIFIVISAGIFFANHLYSYIHNRKADRAKTKNIGRLMSFPYARIIPMHFTLILFNSTSIIGDSNHLALVLFLILKTIADVMMHIIEHANLEDEKNRNR